MPNAVTQREAKRFEQDLARDLGARRVFASGAGFEKADVRRRATFTLRDDGPTRTSQLSFRVEAKTTRLDVFTFRAADWCDLVRVADAAGEIPLFAIRYLRLGVALVVTREAFLHELGFDSWGMLRERMNKSRRLAYNEEIRLDVPVKRGRTVIGDSLCSLNYAAFREKLYAHPDYEPDRPSHRQDSHAP